MATFSLNWSPSPNATYQIVQYKLSTDSSYTNYDTVSPFTDSILVEGLDDNLLYDFRIESDCGEDIVHTDVSSDISLTCPEFETIEVSYSESTLSFIYSFPDLGGDITQYLVRIYMNGSLLQTDVYNAPFSPDIANEIAVDDGNIFAVQVDVVSDDFSKTCYYDDVYTSDCPTITDVEGTVTDDGSVTIDLISFDFSNAPATNQTVQISWRLESDPDEEGSYTDLDPATVNPDGVIIDPSPYTVDGLPDATIVFKVSNICGISSFEKSFQVCTSLEGESTLTPQCASGYNISSDGLYCYKEETHDADCSLVVTPHEACHYDDSVYNEFGTIFYKHNGYNENGTYSTTPTFLKTALAGGAYAGTLWANPSANTTDGRLNKIGVWDCDSQLYVGNLGFSQAISITVSKIYYVAFSADNFGTVKLNGDTVVSQDASALATQLGGGVDVTFKYLHVYPVFLNAGINYLEISGTNSGSIGIFGVEIYNATEAQLVACTTSSGTNGDSGLDDTNLHKYIVFSSKDVVDNDPFVIGNCNCDAYPGSTLIQIDEDTYECKQLLTLSPF